ncbi:MAG: glycoside hydrolase family 11 protein [Bacillota bacterium]|nr:glycoside hydrolase family 11 protein [Bacillota bacterium]
MKQKRFGLYLGILVCLAIIICIVFIFSNKGGNTAKNENTTKNGETAKNGNTTKDVNAAKIITTNQTGIQDGYNYELWKDNGTTSMTLNSGGAFSCSWSNMNNALFRKGKKFDETQTYQQLGNISLNYAANYKPNGNSYLAVYGWTSNPLVEFYIVDSWGSWRPPGAVPKGTITVDGGTYDIYETTRTDQPSIKGNATFEQYWSVRQEKRTSGTISISEHFKKWESMGMKMGKMYEVSLVVEGYQSSGTADVTSNTLTIGGSK